MLNWIISSSALVLVMIILRTIFKGKIDPRIQYALWGIVLIRLLLPFNFISSDFSVSLNDVDSEMIEETEIPISRKVYVNGENEAEFQKAYSEFYNVDISEVPNQDELIKPTMYLQKKIDVKTLLNTIVFSGAALTFIVFAIANLKFYLRLRRMRKIFRDGKPKVYTVAEISSPCLFGNSIYMKKSDSEDKRKSECIIAHEMTHYRHLDGVWSLLRVFAVCLHWYNPLVWVAAVLSKRDSELACDAGTVKKLGETRRIEYGETLLGMLCSKNSAKNVFSVATTMDSGKEV